MADTTDNMSCLQAFLYFLSKVRSKIIIVPALRLDAQTCEGKTFRLEKGHSQTSACRKIRVCISANGTSYLLKAKKKINVSRQASADPTNNDKLNEASIETKEPIRLSSNGKSDVAALYTKRGQKGVNQDAVLVIENFTTRRDTIFCGVFDGHGPDGHLVSKIVRDALPLKLETCHQELLSRYGQDEQVTSAVTTELVTIWKKSLLHAYNLVDRDLRFRNDHTDCVWSGTAAVTLVKQGHHLFLGNVGDSRAILGFKVDDESLIAVQLTTDLKPSLPGEATRIRRCKGRIFALRKEPFVKRVWLPYCNRPGLAMARALGDYCLKSFGVISEPVITYRKLTRKDRFIVLATDGIWDVLSNERVIGIVASTTVRSLSAKAVVDAALREWKSKYPAAKADDCTAVCIFLDPFDVTSSSDSRRNNALRVKLLQFRK